MISDIKQKAMASEIVDFLDRGKQSGTTIAIKIKESYWKTIHLLEIMEAEGLIIKEQKKYQTYWKLARDEENTQITKENETEQ